MELQKEWQEKAYKIMEKYQKEEGEQEYYMYYDVDVPKMLNTMASEMLKAVEGVLNTKLKDVNNDFALDENDASRIDAKICLLENIIAELQTIKPL